MVLFSISSISVSKHIFGCLLQWETKVHVLPKVMNLLFYQYAFATLALQKMAISTGGQPNRSTVMNSLILSLVSRFVRSAEPCMFLLKGRTSEKDMLYTQVAQQSVAG
ncbi:hypothetical protein D1007_48168 [Hordeum vulgare]|nr:hypothetical protein D1007_48168 [Hordeum vulgare]